MNNADRKIITLDRVIFAAFLLLIFSLGFQLPTVSVAGLPVNSTDALFLVCFVLFAAAAVFGRGLVPSRAYFFLSLYAGAFAFASLFAPDIYRSLIKTAATVYLVLLSLLAFNILDTEERIEYAVLAWLAGAILPVLIGLAAIALFYISPSSSLLSYVTYHYGAVPVGNYPRLSSTFISASMFCNFLNASLLMLFIARAREWIRRFVFITSLAATIVCGIFTVSSGLGAIILAVALWIWYVNRETKPTFSRVVLCLGGLAAFAFLASSFIALQPHSTATFVIPFAGFEFYPSSRLLVWMDASKNFASNFLTGVGPGYPAASVMYQNTDGRFSLLTDAHNVFLSVAAQSGVFGLAAVIALCIYLVRVAGTAITERNTIVAGLGVAFITAFIFQGLTGAFEDARHLWVLIGLLIAAVRAGSGVAGKAEGVSA